MRTETEKCKVKSVRFKVKVSLRDLEYTGSNNTTVLHFAFYTLH